MSKPQQNKGLSDEDVIQSRQLHGANVLTPAEKESILIKFLAFFADPIIRILLVALALSVGIALYEYFYAGHSFSIFFEPMGILLAILLATMVGFVLELNNEKTFQSLNEVNDDTLVKTMRCSNVSQVMRRDIVVGDIIILEAGEEIPADAELLESLSLMVNESGLTGEPQASKTTIEADFKKEATYPSNHILKGTTVTEGNCIAKVFNVGDKTESGKVFEAAQVVETEATPLNKKLNWLADKITIASYSLAIIIIIGRLISYALSMNGSNTTNLSLYLGSALALAAVIAWLLGKLQGDNRLKQLGAFMILPIAGIFLYFAYGVSVPTDWLALTSYALGTVMIAVTLIVVSVPEGLPMSVTLSLAFSMKKLMDENTLPRTMHSCETMGATSVICTDKTGTLTQNQMRVHEIDFESDASPELISEAIAMNTTGFLDLSDASKIQTVGNPTEGALLLWLHEQEKNYLNIRENCSLLDRIPFSTERKYMASIIQSQALGKRIALVKGAPEILLGLSVLSEDKKAATLDKLLGYQNKAMRTLGFAYKILEDNQPGLADGKLAVDELHFIGIVAISDPVRSDVPAAIRECINAGIAVKIVTGDTPGTAKEIGRQIGLWSDNDSELSHMSGSEFAELSDEELKARIMDLKILSRAKPAHKERLVRTLKGLDQVVAVTGDGTNDAPALNAANVGLSMGDGTAVAKEASDMTIMDNSFSTISNAVMWGRSLYKNIQRFILFQLTINVVASLIVLVGAFNGTQSPLTVTQMLWVNLIMDTFAALALASLPPSAEVMKERPRKVSDFIISPSMAKNIFSIAAIFFALMMGLLAYFQHTDITSLCQIGTASWGMSNGLSPYERSLFFSIFVMLQFWNIFNAKAFMTKNSALTGILKERLFLLMAATIIIGQILIVSFGGQMFSVTPISLTDWILIIAGSSIVLWIGEIARFFKRD